MTLSSLDFNHPQAANSEVLYLLHILMPHFRGKFACFWHLKNKVLSSRNDYYLEPYFMSSYNRFPILALQRMHWIRSREKEWITHLIASLSHSACCLTQNSISTRACFKKLCCVRMSLGFSPAISREVNEITIPSTSPCSCASTPYNIHANIRGSLNFAITRLYTPSMTSSISS